MFSLIMVCERRKEKESRCVDPTNHDALKNVVAVFCALSQSGLEEDDGGMKDDTCSAFDAAVERMFIFAVGATVCRRSSGIDFSKSRPDLSA